MGSQGPLALLMTKFAISFLIFTTQVLFASDIGNRLEQISYSEKNKMNCFFQYAIECDSLGYVLFFNNKPACSIGCSSLQKGFWKILKGWMIWKKYEHLFPHPNYIFCNENNYLSDGCQILSLYVINKQALLECVSENETIFKKNLGENFSKEIFLDLIEKSKNLDALIGNNEILRGIILGFGEESATAFYLQNSSLPPNTFPQLTETYCCVGGELDGRVYPVSFMGNPRSERVKSLVKTYRQEKDIIQQRYCPSRKKLQLTLEALARAHKVEVSIP